MLLKVQGALRLLGIRWRFEIEMAEQHAVVHVILLDDVAVLLHREV